MEIGEPVRIHEIEPKEIEPQKNPPKEPPPKREKVPAKPEREKETV